MKRNFILSFAILFIVSVLVCGPTYGGSVIWDFSPETLTDGGVPVMPAEATLAGTVEDWTLDGNPDNYDNSAFIAVLFEDGYLSFLDTASVSGNASLLTSDNAAVRDEYALEGPGDRLWIICDHQMLVYGKRANDQPGTVDQTRGQIFWLSFHTSNSTGLALQYVAANYNTENISYFTAIGNSDESQDDYLTENRLIEEGESPNLERRVVTLRITENDDPSTVTVDVKYDDGEYQTIDSEYAGPITNYAPGNEEGDENYLAVVGNNSGSGAIEFNMHNLTITDEAPDGETEVSQWSLF